MKSKHSLLIILIIIFTGISPVFADEIEWVDPQEKTLRLTETFTREGYLIEASDFFENSALITVYDANKRIVARNVTRLNDSMEIEDRLNITIIELQERVGNISVGHGVDVIVDQWVKIETRVAGRPVLKLSVIPRGKIIDNKTIISRVYKSGSEISINFSMRNDGKAVLKSLRLKINSTLPLLSGEKLYYEPPNLEAGKESETIIVRFKAPFTYDRETYTISAEANGIDVFGKSHRASDSISIEVVSGIANKIEIRKYVSEKIYIGDIAVVSISIKNNSSQKIHDALLTDHLPPGLELLDPGLSWNFTLEPFEQKAVSYRIKPEKPGSFFFLPGSSRIEYNGLLGYNDELNKLIVNGPYVVLTKSADSGELLKGENASIILEARNIGNANAIVKLTDEVPAGHSLSGEPLDIETIYDTIVLHPGSSSSTTYILNATEEGSYVLPPARATVFDQFLYQDDRYTQKISSNAVAINVSEKINTVDTVSPPGPAAAPESTLKPAATGTATAPQEQTPGFRGYILILLLIAVWMIIKQNSDNKI